MKHMPRSKELIRNVFIELVEKEGFDKITVKDITEKSGVCRSTFYLYYVDKYNLMSEIQSELLDGLGKLMTAIRSSGPAILCSDDSKEIEKYTDYFLYIQNSSKLFKILLSDKGDGKFFENFSHFLIHWMSETNKDWGTNIPEILAAIIPSWVYLGLITYWIDTGMQISPMQLGETLYEFWRQYFSQKSIAEAILKTKFSS